MDVGVIGNANVVDDRRRVGIRDRAPSCPLDFVGRVRRSVASLDAGLTGSSIDDHVQSHDRRHRNARAAPNCPKRLAIDSGVTASRTPAAPLAT